MKVFRDLTEKPEDFKDFEQKQFDDDEKLKKFFDKCTHKEFTQAIMDIGVLIDITTTYFDFISPQIKEFINLDPKKRNRKFNKFATDLNIKINNEYFFDDDVSILEDMILFDGEIYLFLNKTAFLKIKKTSNL